MKKIISAFLIIATLLTATFTVNASIQCEQVHYPMYFNGTLVPEGDKPILSLNWNTYVPLRKVCEGTGLTVEWNDQKQEIYVENTAALAIKDYTYLANIYDNCTQNMTYASEFQVLIFLALDFLEDGNYETFQKYIDLLTTLEGMIDDRIEQSEFFADSLKGYYDGDIVTKATYDNIENCLKHDLFLSLACNDLHYALVEYANGNITSKAFWEAYDEYKETTNYVQQLVPYPSQTAYVINLFPENFSEYKFLDYQSVNPLNSIKH